MQEAIQFKGDSVSGWLHRPSASWGSLVLTHGAGGNCQMPLLVTVASALAGTGLAVLRYDLPFRAKKGSGPPNPSGAAADRTGLREAAAEMKKSFPGPTYVGGQSYGGRQASMLAAEDPGILQGLLLLSYPLHPPGRPDQLRTAHFSALRVPALFVSGNSDPFGTPDEMRTAIQLITAPTILRTVVGAGHDLKRGKFDVELEVVQPFRQLMEAEGASAR